MNLLNIIKLAKVLTKLSVIDSDQGPITVEEIIEGAEVFIEDANGNVNPAEDGDYVIEDGKRKISVLDGKISRIEEIAEETKEETPAETPAEGTAQVNNEAEGGEASATETPAEETPAEPDERDNRIAELEAILAEKEAKIAELIAEIEALKSAPVETEMKKVENNIPFKTYKNTKF